MERRLRMAHPRCPVHVEMIASPGEMSFPSTPQTRSDGVLYSRITGKIRKLRLSPFLVPPWCANCVRISAAKWGARKSNTG